MAAESARGVRQIFLAAVVLAAVLLLTLWASLPPAPKPVNAPAAEFSGRRSQAVLSRLVGDGTPHPIGSAANDSVRARVLAELEQLGYKPEVQTGFACDEYGSCATAKNVVARLEGKESDAAVLVAAHYDSVPAGPGASDDGAGTATLLEIARALKSLPQPRHSIILLIDDGEEAGLLGARVFVDQHRWATEVRAVVNVDTRGTSGPSLLFETGSANEWIVRLYAKVAKHPATSSLFYTVYKQFPNDTDFTIFKAAGYQGANFAYIGDVVHYHTPLDNFENANASSLQHDGENALPILLALANAELSNLAQKDAVFFDLFEHWTIWWPSSWSLAMAIAAAVVLLLEIGWLIYKKRLSPSAYLWGVLGWLAIVIVTGALGWILQLIVRKAGATPVEWIAHPLALQIAFWSLGLALVSSLGLAFGRWTGPVGLWAGVWTWWALFSVVIAWHTPGISYLFLVPAGVAAIVGIPFAVQKGESDKVANWTAILPLATAAIVGFAPLLMLYDALGSSAFAAIALLTGLVLTPLSPICAESRSVHGLSRIALPSAAIFSTILAAFIAIVVPTYSAKAPERVNLEYWQDGDTGKSQWMVRPASGRLQEPLRVATTFRRMDKGPFPWSGNPVFLADAPSLDGLAAPTFTILESSVAGDTRSYRALLRSERGAPDASVLFPPDAGIESVRMEGEPVPPENERERKYLNGWSYYDCPTMPAKGIEITFTLPTGKPIEVYALDETYALPLEGSFLVKARPFTATPSQNGDVTVVSRRVQLLP
ncbi:MAG TPA: M28 family peptidase [Candidatus Limnocylindria bacterium]|nr:M28 family peptidase [Candidatus Limnocylindria bacterium]